MTKDLRDAFFDGVYEMVQQDQNVIVLTADHGAFGLQKIAEDFPDQYLNVGIAEQSMIGMAAGLSLSGRVVFAYAINNFISLRCLEQINIDLCAMNCNVNLIGVGAGFTYSTDGPTHQGVQDMQAMMVLPNMQVFNATDAVNSKLLAKMAYDNCGPKYFRIEKGSLPNYFDHRDIMAAGLKKIKHGKDVMVVSTGYMVHVAMRVAEEFEERVGVIDLFRVKPINETLLLSMLKGISHLVVLEECTGSGGLGEKIGFLLAKNNVHINFLSIAVPDKHCYEYNDRGSLHKQVGLDHQSVVKKMNVFLEEMSCI